MATEFNYKRAWQELAGPGFEALPQIFKDLYAEVAARHSEFNQVKDLSVPLLLGIEERLEYESDTSLAVASRTIYFWGHWGHTPSATVYYPGLEPKTVYSDMCLASAVKDYIKLMNEYGDPQGEIRTEYHRCGPPDGHGGAHWKLAKMLDQVLARRMEAQLKSIGAAKGCSIEPLEGALRVQVTTRGGGWNNLDFCWATRSNLEKFRELRCFDEEQLIQEFAHEPHHEWFTKSFMDHKPGTKWETSELAQRYQPLVAGAFKIHKVEACNFQPHPYVIGSRHIEEASRRGGSLDESVMKAVPCAYRDSQRGHERCSLPYSKHTSDVVMFIEPLRNVDNAEAAGLLMKIKEAVTADKVQLDGFGIMPSKQGFEILPPVKKEDTDGCQQETPGAGGAGEGPSDLGPLPAGDVDDGPDRAGDAADAAAAEREDQNSPSQVGAGGSPGED